MQRIGVFVCWCGSNIAATVDVQAVSDALSHEPGVVFSTNYQYMCSEAGQNIIKDAIRDYQLTGVVICSCSPRMHEATFRKTVAAAGLNSYMLEVANIREQCSWIHKDKAAATEKAIILGRAAIAKVQLNAPLTAGESPVTKRALVIGGGIAGIQTALDIADAGFEVDIVEKQPTIGGKMAQIDKTFPTLDCAACILTPKMVDCAQNDKINIFAYSEVQDVKGFVGNFHVKIKKKARYVDATKCTGCGECTEKCPMKKVPNEFNLGLDNRRAIYIPFAQAVPKVATIDPNYCNMLKNGKCGAVREGLLRRARSTISRRTRSWSASTARSWSPRAITPSSWISMTSMPIPRARTWCTSLEFERLTNAAGPTGGTLLRPSDGKHPHTHGICAVRGLPLLRRAARASSIARRSAACTPLSTPCCAGRSTRTPRCTCSTSTCVPPARTSTSSTAARWRNTAYITSRVMVGKVVPRSDGKLLVQAQRPAGGRAAAYRGRYGGAGCGHRAGQVRPSAGDHADRLHGYQRFLHRGARQAAPRGKPHGGHLPLRRVPGP